MFFFRRILQNQILPVFCCFSIEKQIDNAQEELNKPFIHDAELEEKLARLRVVNHTLSLDKIEQEADFNDFIAPLEQDNGQEALKEEMEFC